MKKVCTGCPSKGEQGLDNFYLVKMSYNSAKYHEPYYSSKCKKCRNLESSEYAKNNKNSKDKPSQRKFDNSRKSHGVSTGNAYVEALEKRMREL